MKGTNFPLQNRLNSNGESRNLREHWPHPIFALNASGYAMFKFSLIRVTSSYYPVKDHVRSLYTE